MSYGTPAGWPSLAAAALSPQDFPGGARVDGQRYVKPDSLKLAEYDRWFTARTARVDGKRMLTLEDAVSIGRTVDDGDSLIMAVTLGAPAVLPMIVKQVRKDLHLKTTYTKFGRVTSLGVGSDSVCNVIRIGTKKGEIRFVLVAVRVKQITSLVVFAGLPRAQVGVAEARTLGRLIVKRVTGAMSPQNTVIPAIAGTPEVGQTLTASTGSWLGSATRYSYQWLRCDPTGANCLDITGATGAMYVTTDDNANTTLRVEIAATNAYGTAAAVSSEATTAVTPTAPGG